MICKTVEFVSMITFALYFILLIYVFIRNKCGFTNINILILVLFLIIYCLQMSALIKPNCAVESVQQILIFELDILIGIILQLILFRMLSVLLTLRESNSLSKENRIFAMSTSSENVIVLEED